MATRDEIADAEWRGRIETRVDSHERALTALAEDVRSLSQTMTDSVRSLDRLMALAASDRRLVKFALAIGGAVFTAAQVVVQIVFK